MNTFLGMFTGWPAVFAMHSHGNDPFEFLGDLFLLWLGVSIAVHSIPTFKDARAVAQVLGTSRHPTWARRAGNLISACFYAGAIVSMFWFDVIYSLTIVVGLPFLLFEAFLKA